MADKIYNLLKILGYHHPLHPALTHLPVGLTIAAFLFMVIGYLGNRPVFFRTAKHCVVVALLAAVPTAVTGYLDWQHLYQAAFVFAFKMKLILAFVLIALLLAAVSMRTPTGKEAARQLPAYLLSLLTVAALGYFGGEVVYGKKSVSSEQVSLEVAPPQALRSGAKIFEERCSFCHFSDRTDAKVGPGLKGFFQKDKMPVSGLPVSKENLRRQLEKPYDQMPPFNDFDNAQLDALTDYLKSL